MNKKKFKKELDLMIKNGSLSMYFVEKLFIDEKRSLFNNEKIETLIADNFPSMMKTVGKDNVNVFINTLYKHESMRSFLENKETIKYILDNCDYFDFKSVISDCDIENKAQEWIHDNFDYVLSNYSMKKIVSIYNSMQLDEKNKGKMDNYFNQKKEQFLSEVLTTTLTYREKELKEEDMDKLLKKVASIVNKILDKENCNITDTEVLLCGSYSSVLRIGDSIVKVGAPRKTFNIPNDERILQPHLRRDLSEELGVEAVIEVCDRVDTNISINEEELYNIYKEMRDRGIVCGDFKYDNIGRLIKDNPPRNDAANGMIGNVSETLSSGEYVLIDTDFVYREGDPNIHLSSSLSMEFEARYQKQSMKKSR